MYEADTSVSQGIFLVQRLTVYMKIESTRIMIRICEQRENHSVYHLGNIVEFLTIASPNDDKC